MLTPIYICDARNSVTDQLARRPLLRTRLTALSWWCTLTLPIALLALGLWYVVAVHYGTSGTARESFAVRRLVAAFGSFGYAEANCRSVPKFLKLGRVPALQI